MCLTREGKQPQSSLWAEAHKDLCKTNTLEHVLPGTKCYCPYDPLGLWYAFRTKIFWRETYMRSKHFLHFIMISFRNIFAWKLCYRRWGWRAFPRLFWLHWIHVMSRNSNRRCGLGDCSRLWVTGTSCTNARAKTDQCEHSGEPCLLCLLRTPRGPDSALALLPTYPADVACYCNRLYISQRG